MAGITLETITQERIPKITKPEEFQNLVPEMIYCYFEVNQILVNTKNLVNTRRWGLLVATVEVAQYRFTFKAHN